MFVPDSGLQYDGVHWMMKQEARAGWRGGILADEMGLGKTLQMLCVMALRCEPTLVVCPLSALKSWKDDINNFFQPKTFELIDYHQLRQEKRALPNPLPSNAVVLINPESAGRDVWSKTFSRTSEQKDLLCRELSQYCYVPQLFRAQFCKFFHHDFWSSRRLAQCFMKRCFGPLLPSCDANKETKLAQEIFPSSWQTSYRIKLRKPIFF